MSFVRTIPTAIPRGVGVGDSRSIGNQAHCSEFSVLMEGGIDDARFVESTKPLETGHMVGSEQKNAPRRTRGNCVQDTR